MPIHHTKLIIGQPHMTGWLFPQTPTPVEIKYVIIVSSSNSSSALGTNATHHQSGVLPSATPAILSESQPMSR